MISKIKNKIKNKVKGFSLLELLVVTSVFLIVVVLSGQLIRLASFDSQVNTNLAEVQQNSRVALKFLERDITNSGDSYLIGLAGGQGLVGPIISLPAFQQIRGTNTKNMGNNVPTMGNNKQPIFSLLPVRRSDPLGNGASGGGQTAIENGSADRLTVAYEDEFFIAGTQLNFGTNQPDAATATANMAKRAASIMIADPNAVSTSPVSNDEEFQGFWTRGATPLLTLAPLDVNNVSSTGVISYNKIYYDISGVRPGDIFKIATGNTEVLAMVSRVNPGNPANYVASPPSLEFSRDVLDINRTSALPTPASIAALAQPAKDALKATFYPLDFIPVDPEFPDPAPNTVRIRATRVLLYTYLVDPLTRDLIRRRYNNFVPFGGMNTPANAMINDPLCQNVDRFWVSYNLFVPANPPTTTVPSLGNETDLDPDATQTDYSLLQNIRRVNINLILRSTEIDRRTKQPSRFGIQASFSPRNIVYQINENAS